MNWKDLLKMEMETTYRSTEKLLDKVDPDSLAWKPQTGSNWMTVGQLLRHIGEGCGMACKAFITGDWGMPEGVKIEDLTPEQMLPPAEKLPSVASVEEARTLLCADKQIALKAIEEISDDDLANRQMAAPWAPDIQYALGRHLLQMVQHLGVHKAQLFYYLKLQGKPVNTGDLWG